MAWRTGAHNGDAVMRVTSRRSRGAAGGRGGRTGKANAGARAQGNGLGHDQVHYGPSTPTLISFSFPIQIELKSLKFSGTLVRC